MQENFMDRSEVVVGLQGRTDLKRVVIWVFLDE